MKKKDNRGLSMVELLVTVAIMAILSSFFVISMGIIPRTAARSCADGLKTSIGQTRILTMGKKETVFVLIHDADGKYYTQEKVDNGLGTLVDRDKEFCGKSSVKVSYHLESSGVDPWSDLGNFVELAKGSSMTLIFDRSNGSLKQGGAPGAATLCDAILVEGGGIQRKIRIYVATGKVTME